MQNYKPESPDYLKEKVFATVKNSDLKRLTLLFQQKADFNVRDNYQNTPLILAAREGKIDIVRLLLKTNVDKNARSVSGDTPLIWAVRNKHSEVAQALIHAGVNLDIQCYRFKNSALMWAAFNGIEDMAALLIKAGANPNLFNKSNTTALTLAKSKGYNRVIHLIETSPSYNKMNSA